MAGKGFVIFETDIVKLDVDKYELLLNILVTNRDVPEYVHDSFVDPKLFYIVYDVPICMWGWSLSVQHNQMKTSEVDRN